MKVYVVFDPLVEEVRSVHKSYKIAEEKASRLDKENGYDVNSAFLHEIHERKLEE